MKRLYTAQQSAAAMARRSPLAEKVTREPSNTTRAMPASASTVPPTSGHPRRIFSRLSANLPFPNLPYRKVRIAVKSGAELTRKAVLLAWV